MAVRVTIWDAAPSCDFSDDSEPVGLTSEEAPVGAALDGAAEEAEALAAVPSLYDC